MVQGFVGWLQHSGETSVNDRKVKGIGLDRDLSTVPYGSCNCVCFLGRYSTTRCSPGRITTAINPQQFICFRKAYYRERVLFSLPHFLGTQIVFCLRGAHLPSGKLATSPVRH
ncbi:hypothetical protein AVEN_155175-1 [Araneus ventricosus]|uniref:Uncharacterized protein n=1 Tax=Araneus ventricosus TaxID=182803 RepID=A0A4Y2N792_ARAVE|nr:hypothetical protein AVEN_155175-1 [Araneus ventricosus]